MAFYEVIVQNIGKVHEGGFVDTARNQFAVYKNRSIKGIGRAAGEGVSLWKDGEIIEEYTPDEDEDESANVYARHPHRDS
jgi:hypothetical protein